MTTATGEEITTTDVPPFNPNLNNNNNTSSNTLQKQAAKNILNQNRRSTRTNSVALGAPPSLPTTSTTTTTTTTTNTTPTIPTISFNVPSLPLDTVDPRRSPRRGDQSPRSVSPRGGSPRGEPSLPVDPTPIPPPESPQSAESPPPVTTPPNDASGNGYMSVIVTSQQQPIDSSQDPMAIEMNDYTGQEDDYTDSDNLDMAEECAYDGDENEDDFEKKDAPPPPFSHKEFGIELFKYFGSMLTSVLLVSTVAIAYAMFEMYAGCRFVNINFSDWPQWGIITHSVSRIVLNTALCMYPYILLTTFFGFKETMVCLWIGLAASVGSSAWATFNVVKPVLNQTLALLPSYFFFVVALLSSAHYMGRKVKSATFRHLFMGQFVLAAIALVIYDFALVPFYIQTNSINKSIVRILIHPGICAIALFVSRACSSRITPIIPGTNVFPVLIFMWFSTYYGRFFNSNMSLLFMTGTMVIVSLLELVWRTTLRPRDKKIVNTICGYCFNVELQHSNNFDRIYRDFLRHEQMYENTSIITACAVYLAYFSVFDATHFNYSTILTSMAIQFGLEWATDIISLYIESRVHHMDVLRREKLPKGFYFIICYTFFLGISYSTSRIILINENKWL
eukprot:gene178-214_t